MFTAFQACRNRFFFFFLDMRLLKKVCFSQYLSIFGQYLINICQYWSIYGTAYGHAQHAQVAKATGPLGKYRIGNSQQAAFAAGKRKYGKKYDQSAIHISIYRVLLIYPINRYLILYIEYLILYVNYSIYNHT